MSRPRAWNAIDQLSDVTVSLRSAVRCLEGRRVATIRQRTQFPDESLQVPSAKHSFWTVRQHYKLVEQPAWRCGLNETSRKLSITVLRSCLQRVNCGPSHKQRYSTESPTRKYSPESWTSDDDALVLQLGDYQNRATFQEVARALGKPIVAVRKRFDSLRARHGRARRRSWTAEEDELLRHLSGIRMSVGDMCRRLGRCYDVVSRHKKLLGLPATTSRSTPQITPEMDATIVDMYNLGHTWKQIGAQIGIPRLKAMRHSRHRKLVVPRRQPTRMLNPAERIKMLTLLRQGRSVECVAQEIGVTTVCLRNMLMFVAYGHKGSGRVRRHATGFYLYERKGWSWIEIGPELKANIGWLARVYVNSSFEVYKDLFDDDPRGWDEAKLQRITKIVAQRVATRNAELGIGKRSLPRGTRESRDSAHVAEDAVPSHKAVELDRRPAESQVELRDGDGQ